MKTCKVNNVSRLGQFLLCHSLEEKRKILGNKRALINLDRFLTRQTLRPFPLFLKFSRGLIFLELKILVGKI